MPIIITFKSTTMSKRRKTAISTFSAQITSTISVTLVLLVIGIIAFLGLVTQNITNDIKKDIGFTVMLKHSVTPSEVNSLKQKWATAPYVASQLFISAEEALQQESQQMGEDILEMMAGVNPYQPEFEIKVKPQYANRDSIENIKISLLDNLAIDEVISDTSMIDEINYTIGNIMIILAIIAATLVLISFVLINNTVRLTVYSKRFIIHTMKLVGATNGFIRRPFIINNLIHGIIASLITIIILASSLYYLQTIDYSWGQSISWLDATYIFSGIIIAGIIICAISAFFATNKYLRTKYDDLFK